MNERVQQNRRGDTHAQLAIGPFALDPVINDEKWYTLCERVLRICDENAENHSPQCDRFSQACANDVRAFGLRPS